MSTSWEPLAPSERLATEAACARMLFADKRALQTNLKVSLLEIREKELNFYSTNCLTIGVQASLLSGFAGAALMTPVSREPLVLHVVYLLFSVISLSMQRSIPTSSGGL